METTLRLRPATDEDMMLLFDWANDPLTRQMARRRTIIPLDEHDRWFHDRLEDADCRIWIAEMRGTAIGQIRLDRAGKDAEIDISVAPAARGKGLGSAILKALEPLLASDSLPGLTRLTAAVRRENAPSISTFQRAGFVKTGADDDWLHFARVIVDG